MIDEAGGRWSAVVENARRAIAQGERPWYGPQYCTESDGTYPATVSELPNVDVRVTGRKGLEGAVRARIALVLDVGEDDFNLTVQGFARPRRLSQAG